MSVLLAVSTCQSCSPTLLRHWQYFQRQDADYYYILTTDQPCECPPNVPRLAVARDSYISGTVLPQRMIDSIAKLLDLPWRTLILAEYDSVFFHRIRVEEMTEGTAAHLAGYETWNSKAKMFHHNPHCFKREAAIEFVFKARELVNQITVGSPESSPDVFYSWVCQELGMTIQDDLFTEYSRNDLKDLVHLEEARKAYQDGVSIIHGCKTAEELAFITR